MPPPRAAPLALLLALAGCAPRMVEWSVPLTISATAEDPLAAWGSEWCAVRADGQVACWLENDPRADQAVAGPAVAVTVGCGFACAVRPDRTVTCWGRTAPPPAWAREARHRADERLHRAPGLDAPSLEAQ